jgi:hypothetical protein
MHATSVDDPLGKSDEPTYRPTFLLPERYAQALDHVFVRPPKGFSLEMSARLVFKDKVRLTSGKLGYLSDHFGIAARVEAHPPSPR